MLVLDTYEGNVREDEALAAGVAAEDAETVTVDDDQRRRSRFRTETDQGTEVGIVLGRELRAGDVLGSESGDGPLVEVALERVGAVVVDLGDVDAEEPGALVTAVALGHAAGNRHWDVALRDGAVLFPAAESDARMDATIDPHLPDGATVERESVSPAVFDDGGPGVADHSHARDHDDQSHTHDHDHGDHSHAQDHGDQSHRHDHEHDREADPDGDGESA